MKKYCAALAMAIAMAGPALAAEDKPRVPVTAAVTQQKAEFVTNLVTNSAAARTIESSSDAQAKAALAKARSMVEAAKKEAAAGGTESAERKLNEALALVMAESRRISETGMKQDRAEQIYELRKASVKTLLDAYGRVGQEKSASGMGAKQADIQKVLAEAEALAAKGEHAKAVPLLDAAYTRISADVAKLRDGDKLVKELKFASAEEEYHYEVDRNDSHFYLLKLTIAEKQPDPMIAGQAEKMRVEAQGMRDKAETLAKTGKHKDAIVLLNDATGVLIKAMRMAGAYIPG